MSVPNPISISRGAALGAPGATAATRFVGGTASGAPVTGTFAVGDFVIDRTPCIWVCIRAGSPGTWTLPGGYRSAMLGRLGSGLVSYWRLGEASGTTAVDEMGVNTGTYVGSPTLAVTGLLAGDPDTATTLNGSSQYVTAGTTNIPVGATARTLAIWATVPSAGNGGAFIWCNTASGQKFGVYMFKTGNYNLYSDGVTGNNVTYPPGPPLDVPAFYVFELVNSTTFKFFINGVDVTTGCSPSGTFGTAVNTDTLASVTIGRRGGQAQDFPGTLDEAAIWSRALSAAEIAWLYRKGMG